MIGVGIRQVLLASIGGILRPSSASEFGEGGVVTQPDQIRLSANDPEGSEVDDHLMM